MFSLIGKIQEETHRFAIEFNRSKRRRRVSGSELDKIKGVGPARRAALLKSFRSVKAIRAANVDELAEVVPENIARSIREYFDGHHSVQEVLNDKGEKK